MEAGDNPPVGILMVTDKKRCIGAIRHRRYGPSTICKKIPTDAARQRTTRKLYKTGIEKRWAVNLGSLSVFFAMLFIDVLKHLSFDYMKFEYQVSCIMKF